MEEIRIDERSFMRKANYINKRYVNASDEYKAKALNIICREKDKEG